MLHPSGASIPFLAVGFGRNLDTVSTLFTLFVERSVPIVILTPSLRLRTLAEVNYYLRDDGL